MKLLRIRTEGETKGKEDKIKNMEERLKLREGINVRGLYKRGLPWFRRGPYESNVDERLGKLYIKPAAEMSYVAVISFLKNTFGIGR